MKDYFLRDGGKSKKFGLRKRVRSMAQNLINENNLKSDEVNIN